MKSFVAVAMLLAASCAGPDDGDDGDEAEVDDDAGGKADGTSYPQGVYRELEPYPSHMAMLALAVDRSFVRDEQPACPDGCSTVRTVGTYKFTRRGEHRYLRLLDANGVLVGRYEWTLAGDTLALHEANGRASDLPEWMELDRLPDARNVRVTVDAAVSFCKHGCGAYPAIPDAITIACAFVDYNSDVTVTCTFEFSAELRSESWAHAVPASATIPVTAFSTLSGGAKRAFQQLDPQVERIGSWFQGSMTVSLFFGPPSLPDYASLDIGLDEGFRITGYVAPLPFDP